MASSGTKRVGQVGLSLVALVALLAPLGRCAPGGVAASPAGPASANKLPKWEYAVVSAGKVYFASVVQTSLAGGSKAAVAPESKFDSEAISLQASMDELGQLGWELVAVVGAIGGDQELIFKRPYVPETIAAEAALRRREASKVAALLKSVGKPAPVGSGPQLVDLDEQERLERLAAHMATLEARLEAELPGVLGQGVKTERNDINALPEYPSYGDEATLGGTLIVDATERLLSTGNTYRSSQAKGLAKTVCAALVQMGIPNQYSSLATPIVVKVNIHGKTVATQSGSRFIGNDLF
jgi:hypothetical protein